MKVSLVIAGLAFAALLGTVAWLLLSEDAGEPARAAETRMGQGDPPPAQHAARAASAAAPPQQLPEKMDEPVVPQALDCGSPQGNVARIGAEHLAATTFCAELTPLAGVLRPGAPPPMRAQAQRLLEELIDATLADAALAAAQRSVTQAEVDAALAQIQQDPPGAAAPAEVPVRQQIHRRLALRKLVEWRGNLAVPPAEVAAEYERHPDRWQRAGSVKIQPYLSRVAPGSPQAAADAARQAAQRFADAMPTDKPEAVAKANHMSAMPAFDLTAGGSEADLEKAAFSLDVGAWSAPVAVRGGWAVVRMVAKAAPQARPLAQARDEIERTLAALRRQAEQRRILAELREKTNVTVLVQL